MEFKSGLFAIIAFSMFIVATGVIISEWDGAYGSNVTSDLGEYNELNELSGVANETRGKISPNDAETGENAEANTFRGVYGILTSIFSSFDVVIGNDGMLTSLTQRFGIPDYVRQSIVAFVLIGITFSLVAIIFRLSRRSA